MTIDMHNFELGLGHFRLFHYMRTKKSKKKTFNLNVHVTIERI